MSQAACSGAAGAARAASARPHLALGTTAALVLGVELVHRTWTTDLVVLLEAAISAIGLLYAWRVQDKLRLVPLLGLTLGFHLGWVLLHFVVGVQGDVDSSTIYRPQGDALLTGDYPQSEYPVGAVLLFAFETWVSGGATRTANAFAMIPFQLAIVAAVWATRTRFSAWLAALVALWPLNAYYWEFRFDLAPAALLVVGLVLALREHWGWSGAVLGLGAAVKWFPGLGFVALLAWLVASGRQRTASVHSLAFAAVVLALNLPFLLWAPSEVLAAYEQQGERRITPESLWYLPLRPLGLARVSPHIWDSARAPDWANIGAVIIQALLVLAVVLAAVRMRENLPAAVALAAVVPVVFLFTNRIFSPQFIVVVFAALALAAALTVRSAREQLAVGLALAGASIGNAVVFPFALPGYGVTWPFYSAALFALGLAATAWLVWRALAVPPAT